MTIYLTKSEKKAFEALPEAIRKDFKVELEKLSYKDTPERKQVRFEIMDLQDPVFQKLKEEAKDGTSEAECLKLAEKLDVRSVPEGDIAQILFALGPDHMGIFVADLLKKAKTKEDVEIIAGFAGLRHTMLETLNASFFSIS